MRETLGPDDLQYKILAYPPNTTYDPIQFPMGNREAAINVARAMSQDNSFYMTQVIETRIRIEIAKFANENAGMP